MKKYKNLILVLMSVILFVVSAIQPISASSVVMEDKWLSVSKNTTGPRYIVDANGDPFHLFGIARSQYNADTDEDPIYIGVEGLSNHFKKLGCNTIRLAIRTSDMFQFKTTDTNNTDFIEQFGGYNEKGIQSWITRYVDPDVQGIIKSGMYVVLDLHEYPPKDISNEAKVKYAYDHYIKVWKELAKRYKDEPMIVMYEVWNEPYPADQEDFVDDEYDWIGGLRQYFIDCVNEIRKIDQKHILMVSDHNAGWGTAWNSMWQGHTHEVDPVYRNTVHSIHIEKEHLDRLYESPYKNWWASIGEEHNACIIFGEIETEGNMMNATGINNLVKMFREKKNTHHYAGYLWRPHNDVANYVSLWTDFAKEYTTKIQHSQWFVEAETTTSSIFEKVEDARFFGIPYSSTGVKISSDVSSGAVGELLTSSVFPVGTYEFRVRAMGDSKNNSPFAVGYVTAAGKVTELFTVDGNEGNEIYEKSFAFTSKDPFVNLVLIKKGEKGMATNLIDRVIIRADKNIELQKTEKKAILEIVSSTVSSEDSSLATDFSSNQEPSQTTIDSSEDGNSLTNSIPSEKEPAQITTVLVILVIVLGVLAVGVISFVIWKKKMNDKRINK